MQSSILEKAECLGIVEKLSNRGFSFNKRFLCLSEGVLSYYSKPPPNADDEGFTVGMLKALGLKPKLLIDVKHIETIRPADKAIMDKKKKKFMFVIEFKKSLLYKPKDGNSKGKKEEEDIEDVWTFAVQTQEDFDKWVNVLAQAKTIEILGPQPVRLEEPKVILRLQSTLNETKLEKISFPGQKQEYDKGLEMNLTPDKLRKPRKVREQRNVNGSLDQEQNDYEDEEEGEGEDYEEERYVGDNQERGEPQYNEREGYSQEYGQEYQENQEFERERAGRRGNLEQGGEGGEFNEEGEGFVPRRMEEDRLMVMDSSPGNGYEIRNQDLERRNIDNFGIRQKLEMREPKEIRPIDKMNKPVKKGKPKREEKKTGSPVRRVKEEKLLTKRDESMEVKIEKPKTVGEEEWGNKLNGLFNEIFNCSGPIDARIESEFKLAHLVGEFRTQATDLCKNIVDQFGLPVSDWTHGCIETSTTEIERVFSSGNLKIQVTWTQKEKNTYTEKALKLYSHQFRAMNLLNDSVHLLNKKRKDSVYGVPLAVLVDYKGFRCLATSRPSLNPKEDTLLLGPCTADGSYRVNKLIEGDLRSIAMGLNLKEHRFIMRDQVTSVNVPLSIFTEVHQANNKCYYFIKAGDIFPVDIDIETDHTTNFLKVLRPEFLAGYERSLSADALLDTVEHVNNEENDLEVAEAAIYLRSTIVPAFVKKLETLEILVTDSSSLTHALHFHGINIRYLGLICESTNLMHIKEICKIEMIARCIKKVMRNHLADLTLGKSQGEGHLEKHILYSRKKSNLLEQIDRFSLLKREGFESQNTGQRLGESEQEIADCIIELLNLVFGESRESEAFWGDILVNQVAYDYLYKLDPTHKADLNLGGLFHAVLYHCHIKLEFTNSIAEIMGKTPHPFTVEQFLGIEAHSKAYAMGGLDLKALSEKYKHSRVRKEYEPAIKSCLLALSLNNQLSYQHAGLEDPILFGDLAEILFESGDLDKAYAQAREGLQHSRPYHSEALKCLCVMLRVLMVKNDITNAMQIFELAIAALNFHLREQHPLHVTVYNIQGYYYAERGNYEDALALYKASLECCLKTLGETHSLTGEVYLDLGRLSVKMQREEDALRYFEKAFNVYEAAKGGISHECAHVRYLMASSLVSLNKLPEAEECGVYAISVYEKRKDSFYEELVDCYILMCRIGDLKNEIKLAVEFADKVWPMLRKISPKKSVEYQAIVIKINLQVCIGELQVHRKRILSAIFEEIVENLVHENKLHRDVDDGSANYVGKEYIKELFKMCLSCKSIQHVIGNILKVLIGEAEERDLKAFFSDYRRNLEYLNEFHFKESLINFEKLILIQGVKNMEDIFNKF